MQVCDRADLMFFFTLFIYDVFRYNPVFLQIALDGKVKPYSSFIHALLDCGSPSVESLADGGQTLHAFLKTYQASYCPIAILPEGTTSNGRGLLQFLPVFGDDDDLLPEGSDLTILGLCFDWDNSVCPSFTTGSKLSHLSTLLFCPFHRLQIRELAKKDIIFTKGPITSHNRSLTFNSSEGMVGSQISSMLAATLRLRKVSKGAEDKNQFLIFFNDREAKLAAKARR